MSNCDPTLSEVVNVTNLLNGDLGEGAWEDGVTFTASFCEEMLIIKLGGIHIWNSENDDRVAADGGFWDGDEPKEDLLQYCQNKVKLISAYLTEEK